MTLLTSAPGSRPAALVSGGAGFLGSHVARTCLALGHHVVVLDDLSGGFADHVPEGADLVTGSVTDADLVARLFEKHKFTYVYHLAAYAAEGLSHFIRRFNYTTNVVGSVTLINEAIKHRVRCFVFTSSIAVYGSAKPPMTEDTTPTPEDPYGVSKYAVEMDLRCAQEMFGLPWIVFRPHNVYGEHQNLGDPYRNVIGIFMRQLMQGEPLSVFGDGEQTRAFSYVGDVAPHIARAVTCPQAYNQVFNIGADVPYTVNELARVIQEEMGIRGEVRHLPARHEVMHAFASHERAKALLGAIPQTTLAEGIRRMAVWARGAGVRSAHVLGEVEVAEKLPQSWAAVAGR